MTSASDSASPVPPLLPPTGRVAGIDLARGIAVVAMIAYHFTWDLWAFGLTEVDLMGDPVWLAARTAIVSSFLFIAGLCAGLPAAISWNAVKRRLGRLGAAAAAVSLATWMVFPDSWIFFGVLHHMALAGLLAIPLRRLHPLALLALAVAIGAAGTGLASETLNQPLLRWIGMGSVTPSSNDYVPLFPWFAAVAAGLAAGRAAGLGMLRLPALPAVPPALAAAGAALGRLGRWSLIVYLVHQPLLYGAVWAFVAAGYGQATRPGEQESAFLQSCTNTCKDNGGAVESCVRSCDCSLLGLRDEGLWRPLLTGALTPAQAGQAEAIVRACAPGDTAK